MTLHDHQRSRNPSPERSWAEKCLGCAGGLQQFWPMVVVRKWLNIPDNISDYSADSDDSIHDPVAAEALYPWPKESRLKDENGNDFGSDPNGPFPKSRRRKSETSRSQYIETKELKVSVNTWNLGGELPPDDLNIKDLLDTDYPADIYVIGFQEIIPLNAGNIFGSEDTYPISIWENIIRETLNKIQPIKTEFESYSDPPSPSRFNIENEVLLGSDNDSEGQNCKYANGNNWLEKLDLDSIMYKKRPKYVRIVSKQMVGVFLTIWVSKSLKKHIKNVHVSTVGVGAMGFIGNKGSISASMCIYETNFCFICTHLTSGEREVDLIKRNADVDDIHKRTSFNSMSQVSLPRTIKDHERIIWLGDLNYRINLPYEETRDLISKNDWSKLLESDQLGWELREGGVFEGWMEGNLNFPPTYKYELNSEKYYGDDIKVGRRNPAWCDRILSFGKGMRQVSYKRVENRLSDHRPVSSLYFIEVEVCSLRKFKKAVNGNMMKLMEESDALAFKHDSFN
ncbi:hypothetical protein LXL04_030033 [Taraxacum kok-saghyz]